MKLKFSLIILLLVFPTITTQIGSLDSIQPQQVTVPAPVFVSLIPSGEPEGSYIFQINQTIEIQYLTTRNEVDGILLLGNGSNLVQEFDHPDVLEFKLDRSQKNVSWYKIELNVTSYTQFIAYSWSTVKSNGTYEEINFKDGATGHELWTTEGQQFPIFDKITDDTSNLRVEGDHFYSPIGSNVSIVYTAQDPLNDTSVTLVFSNTSEGLYNDSVSKKVPMDQFEFANENQSRFIYNFTLEQRLLYFTAFNDYGWERKFAIVNEHHSITNGFFTEVDYSQGFDEYTNVDDIIFNVTAYNETVDDEFFYRIREFENETSKDPLEEWQEINIDLNKINSTLVNLTLTYNTTKDTYQVNLGKFSVNRTIEFQPFVRYLTGTHYLSDPSRIVIQDAKPRITLLSENNTYIRSPNATIRFSFDTVRGSIENATVKSGILTETLLSNFDNYTISFLDNLQEIVEGDHIIILNVTNSLPIFNSSDPLFLTQTISIVFKVDFTAPVVNFDVDNPTETHDEGKITLKFNYTDSTIVDSGIRYVLLSWGDGITINATGLESASYKFRSSGVYTITLTAYDQVGNSNSTSFTVTATVTPFSTTIKRETPLELSSIIVGLISTWIVLNIVRIKRKEK
ncbi:MAG: PKD domain-containing protein [Candidatus Kariarchaeaceae archaeon]|jgi:hypothetical protein